MIDWYDWGETLLIGVALWLGALVLSPVWRYLQGRLGLADFDKRRRVAEAALLAEAAQLALAAIRLLIDQRPGDRVYQAQLRRAVGGYAYDLAVRFRPQPECRPHREPGPCGTREEWRLVRQVVASLVPIPDDSGDMVVTCRRPSPGGRRVPVGDRRDFRIYLRNLNRH